MGPLRGLTSSSSNIKSYLLLPLILSKASLPSSIISKSTSLFLSNLLINLPSLPTYKISFLSILFSYSSNLLLSTTNF